MGLCFAGLGDCNSTTTTDISNITSNDININNSLHTTIDQDCNQTALQNNVINIIGSNVSQLTASQKNSLQSMCIMQSILKSDVSADVTQKLLDAIKNNVVTKGGLLGSPATNNTISTNLTNNNASIDNSKFNDISKKCILQTSQSNLLNIIGSNVTDTTTDQANQSFLKCLSQYSDDTLIKASDLADTQNNTDNTTSTKSGDVGDSISTAAQGIGAALSSFISSYTYPLLIGGICSCVLIVGVIIMIFMNPGKVAELAKTAKDVYSTMKK